MFIDRIVTSPERVNLIGDAQSKLHQAGYFEAGFELAVETAGELGGSTPVESAALQRAYIRGYMEAVKNLYYFKETFVPKAKASKPAPDFGAGSSLLYTNTITKEELENVRGKDPR